MATIKSDSEKAKSAEKTSSTKPAVRGRTPAPYIKPADVLVPKMSVVAGTLNTSDTPSATASLADNDQPQMVKKQELVERIVKASGAKKKDVKLIVEAALGVLGDALSAGEELNLPPLGKMKVNRQRDEGNAEILILKLRRGGGKGGGAAAASKETLAQDREDD
ncbi:HU family DNA-binding protein [Pseudorhodobacter sp.]|uniref:HU family DNA-binding protein n=1 Tax=Pseudorhodobacter sp. TaxID=1934400 RepID=UPI002AFFB4DD|nr:HU family DNA-binding protein [Pseudorhodobacter sp.]